MELPSDIDGAFWSAFWSSTESSVVTATFWVVTDWLATVVFRSNSSASTGNTKTKSAAAACFLVKPVEPSELKEEELGRSPWSIRRSVVPQRDLLSQ